MNCSKKVSVIIPVYKAQDYLNRCIDSVLQQTYKNLEIILVDDGSPDSCGEICDSYKKRDQRVTVIHQPNSGQSIARNSAIKIATGEYFVFLDSDDVAPEMMVETLIQTCELKKTDIAIGDYISFSDTVPQIIKHKEKKIDSVLVYKGYEIIPYMHTVPGEKYVVMWGKIFSASLFENVSFPEGRICEDLAVLYKLYDKAERIALIDLPVYFYFRGNSSSSTFCLSDKFYQDVYVALDEEIDYLNTRHPEFVHYAQKTYMYWILDEYRKIFKLNEKRMYKKELYKKYTRVYRTCKKLPVEKFYHVFRFLPNIYCKLKQ